MHKGHRASALAWQCASYLQGRAQTNVEAHLDGTLLHTTSGRRRLGFINGMCRVRGRKGSLNAEGITPMPESFLEDDVGAQEGIAWRCQCDILSDRFLGDGCFTASRNKSFHGS